MNGMNSYLGDKIIQETIKGGPAYYRAEKQAPNLLLARYRAEQREAPAEIARRVLCLRLPWVFAIVRLPRWMPLGTLLE